LHFPIVRQFPFHLSLVRVLPIANRVCWIVLLGLLCDPPDDLTAHESEIFDLLAADFTDFRESLLESPIQMQTNVTIILSQVIVGALITFIFHSFKQKEVELNWVFVARLESDVRRLLLGFSSPELNSFHDGIFKIIPPEVQKWAPRTLGTAMNSGGKIEATDLLASFSHQRRCREAWLDRRGCMFQTNARTTLVNRGLALRGSRAPVDGPRHVIMKGTAERNSLELVKAAAVVDHTVSLVAEHREVVNAELEDIWGVETACVAHLRKEAKLVRPLGFSFASFRAARVRRAVQKRVREDERDLTPSELRKKQVKELHEIIDEIAKKYSDMWDRNAHKNRTSAAVLDEYFAAGREFRAPGPTEIG
jgi:hypothetical protein